MAFGEGRTVVFRQGPTGNVSDEVLNIAMDGFSKSPYFQLINHEPELIAMRTTLSPEVQLQPTMSVNSTNYNTTTTTADSTPMIVWIIDMRRMLEGSPFSIPEQTVALAKKTLSTNPRLHDNLKIIFFDYRDKVFSLCRRNKGRAVRQLIDLLGSQNVRLVTQQVVGGAIRKWDSDLDFVKQGEVIQHNFPCFDYPALHAPYTVRSEYADAVQRDYVKLLPAAKKMDTTTINMTNRAAGVFSPCDTNRPIDVAHFWTVKEKEAHCKLRDGVNKVLLQQQLNTTTSGRGTTRRLNIMAQAVSEGGGTGRTELQSAYVQALLECKIIVVAQRDDWEDHYRFFEAIIGGALVMTDPMVSLPEGYANGTNIIIYESFDELRDLILYYLDHPVERLKIARRGWELAMREHRTYHWMEKLFFGKILTE